MDKERFINAINHLENHLRYWEKICSLFESITPEYIAIPYIELLKIIMPDKFNWIDYYIFDLDFGKKYKDGMIKRGNGKNTELKTVEDLWNLLQEGKEK